LGTFFGTDGTDIMEVTALKRMANITYGRSGTVEKWLPLSGISSMLDRRMQLMRTPTILASLVLLNFGAALHSSAAASVLPHKLEASKRSLVNLLSMADMRGPSLAKCRDDIINGKSVGSADCVEAIAGLKKLMTGMGFAYKEGADSEKLMLDIIKDAGDKEASRTSDAK
jgi:hypothetical protein